MKRVSTSEQLQAALAKIGDPTEKANGHVLPSFETLRVPPQELPMRGTAAVFHARLIRDSLFISRICFAWRAFDNIVIFYSFLR